MSEDEDRAAILLRPGLIPTKGKEALQMHTTTHGARCEAHSWPNEGLAARLIDVMRVRPAGEGINVCRACLMRAKGLTAMLHKTGEG